MNIGTFAPGRSAPADHFKKDANGFDLPIALEPILGSGQVAFDRPGNFAISCNSDVSRRGGTSA